MKTGDAISRIRNIIKSVSEDAFITDRLIYSILSKWNRHYLSQLKTQGLVGFVKSPNIYIHIPCLELEDGSLIDDCCVGIDLDIDCVIKKTKKKLPRIMTVGGNPLIRSVTSLDGSYRFYYTNVTTYNAIKRSKYYKYNKRGYFFIQNDYLIFPNADIEAVSMEAVFENEIDGLLCQGGECPNPLEASLSVPDQVMAMAEESTIKELMILYQLPQDVLGDDKQKANRP